MLRQPTPNLTGLRFGKLLIVAREKNDAHGNSKWVCRCSCGVEKIMSGQHLGPLGNKSCGCLKKESCKDLTGQRFGRLVVVSRDKNDRFGRSRWCCRCDCGEEKVIDIGNLKNFTRSCGCLRKEIASALTASPEWRRHCSERQKGEKSHRWKGGLTAKRILIRNSAEYKNWRAYVFQRDRHTCQNCGIRGGELQAHHIKAFAFFPELRFEISNGQTLCGPCHKKTPSYQAHKNVVG